VQAIRDRYARRPSLEWAREMYRRHRGTSAALNDRLQFATRARELTL
jgi:hypothetical protein